MKDTLRSILLLGMLFLLSSCGSSRTEQPRAVAATHTTQPTVTFNSIPTISPTATPTSTLEPTPTPLGGSEFALIGFKNCRSFPCRAWDGGSTLRLNLSTGEYDEIANGEYLLEDLSPDNTSLLMSRGRFLYITDLDGNNPAPIAENFVDSLESRAYWMGSGEIIYIGFEGPERYIYKISPTGTSMKLTAQGRKPLALIPTSRIDGVYWEEGQVSSGGDSTFEGYHWSPSDGTETTDLDYVKAYLSPNGDFVASQSLEQFTNPSTAANLTVSGITGSDAFDLDLSLEGSWVALHGGIWSPDNSKLIILRSICNPICDDDRPVLVNVETMSISALPPEAGAPTFAWGWSPDSQELLIADYSAQPGLTLLYIETGEIQRVDLGEENRFITQVIWPALP